MLIQRALKRLSEANDIRHLTVERDAHEDAAIDHAKGIIVFRTEDEASTGSSHAQIVAHTVESAEKHLRLAQHGPIAVGSLTVNTRGSRTP